MFQNREQQISVFLSHLRSPSRPRLPSSLKTTRKDPIRLTKMDVDNYLEGLRHTKICRRAPIQPPQPGTQIKLDAVGCYNLELDIGDRRGFSTYTLREVPMFLVEAFRLLRQHGMAVEGIFRKEGNLNRIRNVWPTYFGCKEIPEQCNTHDICSMIKRFFREMRTPLLASHQTQLLQIECQYEGSERVNNLLETVRKLPQGHLGTLAFLMRQLKYFGDNCDKGHQMTVDNLALVFAPTLFRDDIQIVAGKKKKGSQENVISSVCNDNELKVAVLIDLIESAHKIGVPRDYYIASRRPSDPSEKTRFYKVASSSRLAGNSPRSSSARPSPRQHAVVVNDYHPRSNALGKSMSVRPEEDTKIRMLPSRRRSSSVVRELFTTLSNKVFLKRGASPSGQHRRASDDAADMIDGCSRLSRDREKTPLGNSSSVDGVSHVYVDDGDENESGEGSVNRRKDDTNPLTNSKAEASGSETNKKATSKQHHQRSEQVSNMTKVLSFGNIEGDSGVREGEQMCSSSGAITGTTATNQDNEKAQTSEMREKKEKIDTVGGDAIRLRCPKNPGEPSAAESTAPNDNNSDRSHQHAHGGHGTRKGSVMSASSSSTSTHSHHHQQMSDGARRGALAAAAADTATAVVDSDEVATTHRRRSRRESPRKHLTVNSRVKPVASPTRNINSNWMKVPPDEEPDDLHATTIRRKESAEKSKVIANGKILKRNSSKTSTKCSNSSKSSSKVGDPSISLLDQCNGVPERNTTERRRWHTTPIRPSALLRRNQPNTLTTGLKATQVHVRDRRSTTSFGSAMEENANLRRTDKKKRGSSSALSCNDQSHVNSDEENNTASLMSPSGDTSTLLQQKGLESRERRAKRHKRREEAVKGLSKRSDSVLSSGVESDATKTATTKIVSNNLLDDVTNELERLEQLRSGEGKRRVVGSMPTTTSGTMGGSLTSLTLLANGYPVPSSMATATTKSSPSKTLTTSACSSSQISKTSSRLHADGTRQVTTINYHNTKTCTSSQSVTATSSQSPATTPITDSVDRPNVASPIAQIPAGLSSSSKTQSHSESSQKLLKRRSTSSAVALATDGSSSRGRSPSSKKPTSSTTLSSKTAKSIIQNSGVNDKHRHSSTVVKSANQLKENIPVLITAGTSGNIPTGTASVPSIDASVAGMSMPLLRRAKTAADSLSYRTMTTTTKSGSSSLEQKDSMRIYRRGRIDGVTKVSFNESEFAKSEDIKKQILGAQTDKDIKYGPAHIPFDARPSVAYIKRNNRGIVQQRVSQFAQLGTNHTSAANDETLKDRYSSLVEFAKPSAPPASHGLRKLERHDTLSPQAPPVVSVSARAKKFEALTEAAVASSSTSWNQRRKGGAFRKTSDTVNAIGSKVSRRAAGERRAIGERRESRVTRHLLSKSLGKLELLASGVIGVSASSNTKKTSFAHTAALGLESSTSASGAGHQLKPTSLTNISEYVRFVGGTSKRANSQDFGTTSANSSSISSGTSTTIRKITKLNRKRLKYVNPVLTARTMNLHSVERSQVDI